MSDGGGVTAAPKTTWSPARLATALVVGLAAAWILVLADREWTVATAKSSAIADPGEFLVTLVDGMTFAGLLFVVAAGFTLVFGLMRTVNMAHGALFLLSAYIAVQVQQAMVGLERGIEPEDVGLADWFVPVFVGALIAAVIGVAVQQLFLRWNQGQELRQAIITVAIGIIVADQILAQFGGLAQGMEWPGATVHFFELLGQRYAVSRLFMAATAAAIGIALWLGLNKTRIGLIIKAGVDDREMVRALGINIGLVFALTFFVGAFLAGLGGAIGATFADVNPASEGQWLLNSLVVVIIGGLGSIRGAVVGSLLYGLTLNLAPAYLPVNYTFYSIILTFVVLAIVLAVRPSGLFGRPEV
ncbi:MAG: branched-chain amino acid ABC transporter permease [Actinomycetota bacterium]